jgi:flagellin FlaB
MIRNTVRFMKNLRNEEVGSPVVKSAVRFVKRIGNEEAGITALETAIILIAFVVVASVFAFTMLSAGTFSTERGKEAIYAGLAEVQSSIEVKGGVLALADAEGADEDVDNLVFTIANVLAGEPVDLTTGDSAVVVFEYRDATQRFSLANDAWSVDWKGNHNLNELLEVGELAEINVTLPTTTSLGINTTFVLEMKPPSGAVVNLQRTTPAYMNVVNDLK